MGFLFSMIVTAGAEFNNFNVIGGVKDSDPVFLGSFNRLHHIALKIESVAHNQVSVIQ